jgi:hypothetical protein
MRSAVSSLLFWLAFGTSLAAGQATAPPSQATITFYSGGNLLKASLPQTKSATFQGCIFDGQQLLGCIAYRGFTTFQIAPGAHAFSASLSSHHAAKNSQTEMTLEPGKNYYVRAVKENSAFKHVLGDSQGRLDVVSCQVAHDETRDSGEMKEDHLKTWYRKPVPAQVPPCSSTP